MVSKSYSFLALMLLAMTAICAIQVSVSYGQTNNSVNEENYETRLKRELNAWVIGLAAGKLEGAPIRLAEELSRVVDDGDNMHVLPIITRGPSSNVHALLYLRGVDLAVINADSLNFYKKQGKIRNIDRRINYVTQLFLSELHVLARPEIRSIEDLAGKAVNFNTRGTSASFSGPEMFRRLGIRVREKFIPHPIAMQKMKKGPEIAAVVFVTGKPVRPLVRKKWPEGFKLLSATYNEKLTDYYLPATLSSKDYPALIKPGQTLNTVAVPTVLAAYNWKPGTVRHRRIQRFVRYMLKRWGKLQRPPYHKKWREINLNAKVPGWRRLPTVETQLQSIALENDSAKLKLAFDQFLRSFLRRNGVKNLSQKEEKELFQKFYAYWKSTNN